MQQLHLDNKRKFKILLLITGVIIAVSVPLFLPHFLHGHGFHTGIHIAGIILGSFLSIVGAITYLEYRTTRLLLVFFAFFTVTVCRDSVCPKHGISFLAILFQCRFYHDTFAYTHDADFLFDWDL